jgi:membrane protein required for colicin V production
LVSEKQQPEWVKNARTRPILTETADRIVALLPEDAAATIDSWIKSRASAATNELAPPPADDSAASNPKAAGDPPVATTPAPAAPKKTDSAAGASNSTTDKQKLDALINKNIPPPAPFAPAPKQ